MRKHSLLLLFWGIGLAFLILLKFLLNTDFHYNEIDCLISYTLEKPKFSGGYMTFLILDMFPLFVFQILMGTCIYKHFYSAGIYYFIRIKNKSIWFINEYIKLFLQTVMFWVLYYGSFIILTALLSDFSYSWSTLVLYGYSMIYIILYENIIVLLINLFAICWGSQNSVPVVYGAQVLLVFSFLLFDENKMNETNTFFLKLNPVSNLILTWHSTNNLDLNNNINILNINFSLNFSIVYFVIITLCVLLLWLIVINNMDVSLSSKELE